MVEKTWSETVETPSVVGRVVRLVLADDQTLFLAGLVRLLAEDPRVQLVGQARDGADAVKKALATRPDVVLMDLKMPRMDGLEATRQIVASCPEVKVVILTSYVAESLVMQTLRAGASGYLLKDSDPEAIVLSLQAVVAGETVMTGSIANRVLEMMNGTKSSKEFYEGLTFREIEILKMLASGAANKEIAYRLKISAKTVRNHVANTYDKLGVHDRSQAALWAVRKGLVEL